MITASSAFLTANAKLTKRPIYSIEIDGYPSSFNNAQGSIVDFTQDYLVTLGDVDANIAIADGTGVVANEVDGYLINGHGLYLAGSRGALVADADKNIWSFVQAFDGSSPLKVSKVTITPVLTGPPPASFTDYNLSLADFSRESARLASSGRILFAAGLTVYRLNTADGTTSPLYTAPSGDGPFSDGDVIRISNLSGDRLLVYTQSHIYEIDAVLVNTVYHTWVNTDFGLGNIGSMAYDQTTRSAWAVTSGFYRLDLDAVTKTLLIASRTNYRLAMNSVAGCVGMVLVGSRNIQAAVIADNSIITGTLPDDGGGGGSVGVLIADKDGFFWTADNFATDIGTPSWKIEPVALTVVRTVGAYHFGTDPGANNTPRAQAWVTVHLEHHLTGSPWLTGIDDLPLTVSELDGGAELGELVFRLQDRGAAITAAFPTFTFEGKKVQLRTGYPGMAYGDYLLLFTGVIDKVESVNANEEYQFTCSDNSDVLNKVIYTIADDGFPTDSSHLRTLNAHPLDILLNILNTEIGLSGAEIDTAKITDYRDGIFAGVQFQFNIDSPPVAKDFIESQLMKPLGGYIWFNNEGKISVNFFYNPDSTSVMSLSGDTVLDIPEAMQSDLVDVLSMRFDKDDQGKFMAEDIEQYAPSISLYGQFGSIIIEADGVRSGLQGFFVAAFTARMVFLRYGKKGLKFESLGFLWTTCVLEPGDIVLLSHAQVPDRLAGLMGITNKKFAVLDRTVKFTEAVVEFTLIDAAYLNQFGNGGVAYKYAPDAEGDFTADSTSDKNKYMFLCGDDDKYSDGTTAHALA